MPIKSVLTAGLLAFVAASLAVAVADVAGLRGGATAPPAGPPASGERVVAYYLHTATRCPTCRAMEAHARDALAPRVAAGEVAWRIVNYEEPANRHFVEAFDLVCTSLVLVQERDGAVVRWKNLERIWDLHEDRTASVEYVRAEVAAFEGGKP